ncbi:MAG: hypothetical protein K2X29_12585 [Candidatus Obscuribacterales bacterium]|nr:hypothetical protein [Candidatus Obscuribacterales bacterium]
MRSFIKHDYIKAGEDALTNGLAYVRYIKYRPGEDRCERIFFDAHGGVAEETVIERIQQERSKYVLMHMLIVSPGVKGADMETYTREVMTGISQKKIQDLEWYAVIHNNTANPHAHVVLLSTDRSGLPVIMRRSDYTEMKHAGDRFLEACGLIERYYDKESKQERIFVRKYQCFEPWERVWEEEEFKFKETRLVRHIKSRTIQTKAQLKEPPVKQVKQKTLVEWLEALYHKDQLRIERELVHVVTRWQVGNHQHRIVDQKSERRNRDE